MAKIIKSLPLSVAAAKRSATWRRPVHRWRGQRMDTPELEMALAQDADARRRRTICMMMDLHGVPNTEKAHLLAYPVIWTPKVLDELGLPPHPATLVIWRKQAGDRSGSIKRGEG